MDRLDADEALGIVGSARRRMAAEVYMPRWYAPSYGLGCGGLIAAHALPTPGLAAAGSALCMIALAALYVTWSRRAGVSVNGYRAGSTLPIALGLVAAWFAIGLWALRARWDHGVVWAPLAGGAALGVLAAVASAAWDRAWRRDMARSR